MPSYLETIPIEVFATIAKDLDARSLGNLRLASRQMAQRATMDSFTRGFCAMRLVLTRERLQSFLYAIDSYSQLGRFIEALTLVFVIPDTARLEARFATGMEISEFKLSFFEIMQTEAAIAQIEAQQQRMRRDDKFIPALLCDVFALVKSKVHRLKRMSLQVAISEHPNEPPRFPRDALSVKGPSLRRAATRTFQRVLSCLRKSELSVDSLDVFDASPESLLCSVSCDALAGMDFTALSSLRSLSISVVDMMSDPFLGEDSPDVQELVAVATFERAIFLGLSDMLKRCPQLEDLRISFHTPNRSLMTDCFSKFLMPQQLEELAANVYLPKLRKLSIGGLRLEAIHMEEFLEKHRATLRSFELRSSRFVNMGGSLHEVVNHLRHFPLLSEISFSDISESGRGTVYFAGKKEQACTIISGDFFGRSQIRRWGDDVRKPVPYDNGEDHVDITSFDAARSDRAIALRKLEFGNYHFFSH